MAWESSATLREQSEDLPHFVLVTAFDHYAIEAFRMEALDYLLKPVRKTRLDETIQRAQRLFGETAPPNRFLPFLAAKISEPRFW